MALFRLKGYAYTKELIELGIYQYNARIKELRTAGHEIISQKINGMCGFVYNSVCACVFTLPTEGRSI